MPKQLKKDFSYQSRLWRDGLRNDLRKDPFDSSETLLSSNKFYFRFDINYSNTNSFRLTEKKLIIYTDGAARGNPGPGGYGAILKWGSVSKELSAGYRLTTNNRMELIAVIAALETLKKHHLQILIYSDSQYVVRAVEQGWLKNWIATNFKGGKKNKDLWLRYHQLAQRQNIQFSWVKGHADNPYNNRCDELATAAADGIDLLVDEEYELTKGE